MYLIYVANMDSNYRLATYCFITPGDFFCCWADTATVLKGTKRQDVEHMQSCNKLNSEILSLLFKVYCNYLRKCCPQEGSVITFIPSLEAEPPQACLWRKGWRVGRKEGRRKGAGYIQLAVTAGQWHSWHTRTIDDVRKFILTDEEGCGGSFGWSP